MTSILEPQTAIPATTPRRRFVLRPDVLFDGVASLDRPSVVVDGPEIVAVETRRFQPSSDVDVVDLPGHSVVPGLIDIHVHLIFDATATAIDALASRTDDQALETMIDAGRTMVRAGITTVRDLGDRAYLATRVQQQAGDEPMPTIVAAGPPITTPGGHCHFLGVAASGVDELRASVREHVEHGVGVIKVMASGGNATDGSDPTTVQYSEAEMRALVDEAHHHGLPVVAHAHSADAIVHAVAARVDGIEHCTFVTPHGVDAPQHVIDAIARQQIVIGATVGRLPGFTPPPTIARNIADIMNTHRRLRAAGASVLAGTDAGLAPVKPHDILPYGIEQLTAVGMSNAEALRANTADAARALGLGDRKGRITAGHDADLLVVAGDPLLDLARLREVEAVWCRGERAR